MFEKDAEEHTKKNFCGCCPLTWKNQCKNFVNCGYHDSWKDGAEFGYNKCFEQIRKIVNEHTRLDCIIPELLRLKEIE